jgi:hypothetical protein
MRVRRLLQGLLGVVFLATFWLHWQFEREFQFYPIAPDPFSGRVVPYEVQGIKYVTAAEYDRSWWLFRIALASMTAATLLQLVSPRAPHRR